MKRTKETTESPALPPPQFLRRADRPALAYNAYHLDSLGKNKPTVIFLGGFRSDRNGTKALFVEEWCRRRGQPFVRFDYSAHGDSEGDFAACTLSTWLEDVLAIIDTLAVSPALLIGSSMGGWLALRAAQERPEAVAGLIGIAAAPDFTREIGPARLSKAQWEELKSKGRITVATPYDPAPYVFTYDLITDGERHIMLEKPLDIRVPVRLLQGMKDPDVPWQKALKIRAVLEQGGNRDVEVFMAPAGDHRLSEPGDLALLARVLEETNEHIAAARAEQTQERSASTSGYI